MWSPQLPVALRWDHNAHYHRLLLRQLPARSATALDVGCGAGALARQLTARADRVDAIDTSAAMIDRARALSAGVTAVRWLTGDLLDPGLALRPGYDVVTATSSLHHMPLHDALTRMSELVLPGGVLVIVGLYRLDTVSDFALEALRLPANAAAGAVMAARGRAGKPHDEGMPVRPPTTTLAQIRAAAAALLPGARLRRHLFWRYSLVWHRP